MGVWFGEQRENGQSIARQTHTTAQQKARSRLASCVRIDFRTRSETYDLRRGL